MQYDENSDTNQNRYDRMREAAENALRVTRYANDHAKSVIETMEMKLGRALKKESKRRKKLWKKRNKKIKNAMENSKYMLSSAIDDADMKIEIVATIVNRARDDHSDAASTCVHIDLSQCFIHTESLRNKQHSQTHRYSNIDVDYARTA